jgi:4'-phosphopantetheinyl transferase
MSLPASGTVDLWRASARADLVGKFETLLDVCERARAQRYHRESDRRRFIAARGLLRYLLGQYLDAEPRTIQLLPGTFGKLGVAAPLEFSVTHSHEWIALAFASGARVGIDLQIITPEPNLPLFAKRCLTGRELEVILGLPAEDRARAFYATWALKEAFLKGTGYGLTRPMRAIEIASSPAGRPNLTWVEWDSSAPSSWQLHPLACDPHYAAAIAIEAYAQTNPMAPGSFWKSVDVARCRV